MSPWWSSKLVKSHSPPGKGMGGRPLKPLDQQIIQNPNKVKKAIAKRENAKVSKFRFASYLYLSCMSVACLSSASRYSTLSRSSCVAWAGENSSMAARDLASF